MTGRAKVRRGESGHDDEAMIYLLKPSPRQNFCNDKNRTTLGDSLTGKVVAPWLVTAMTLLLLLLIVRQNGHAHARKGEAKPERLLARDGKAGGFLCRAAKPVVTKKPPAMGKAKVI
jgi:hypothetical protein